MIKKELLSLAKLNNGIEIILNIINIYILSILIHISIVILSNVSGKGFNSCCSYQRTT